LSATLFEESGRPIATIGSLSLRELPRNLAGAGSAHRDSLFAVKWSPLGAEIVEQQGQCALLAEDQQVPLASLQVAGSPLEVCRGLEDLLAAIDREGTAPKLVLVDCRAAAVIDDGGQLPGVARDRLHRALSLMQSWLSDERLGACRLVFVTQGAIPVVAGEDVSDLAGASLSGLLLSPQAQHPERLVLRDLLDSRRSLATL